MCLVRRDIKSIDDVSVVVFCLMKELLIFLDYLQGDVQAAEHQAAAEYTRNLLSRTLSICVVSQNSPRARWAG